MTARVNQAGLTIDANLYAFINQKVIPGTGVEIESFWLGFAQIIEKLTPINRELLLKRDDLQLQIDQYHQQHPHWNKHHYHAFLKQIGYLVEPPAAFSILTECVEPEIANMAGPQLVVPISNARFALNAANARWGSLYDAVYGSDVINHDGKWAVTKHFNFLRAEQVIQFGRAFLDEHFPLSFGSHSEATAYAVVDHKLVVTLDKTTQTGLAHEAQFVGYQGDKNNPNALLLVNHNLHISIEFDAHHPIAQKDKAGIKDILLESALSTIMDCEDSVAAVDADDKIEVYRNWLGLMQGNLSAEFTKNNKRQVRSLASDKVYLSKNNETLVMKGRSMMLIRNVGHLMTSNAILDQYGDEVFEGMMDGVITSLIALHDIRGNHSLKNSTTQSINIVKPKMHGPEEVAFTNTLFEHIESLLMLPKNTIKMGIMDEERRTSVNLAACLAEAKERVIFINTGFLDRTGDEIHTSMLAGAMLPKEQIKQQPWINAYENNNVDTGLTCGLAGKAQIGKGMWPMPDEMAAMMNQKGMHPQSGANTAWVPSPIAATLHALHYHQYDVFSLQQVIKNRTKASIEEILCPPLHPEPKSMTAEQIQAELDNNVQGILGYMVRWVEQGIGCSKVPDINHIGLMEDRATLRIASQHIANWLYHGICNEQQVLNTLKAMAKVVDRQNQDDLAYHPMSDNFNESLAFQAAVELIMTATKQPNGYTEPVLHRYRLAYKSNVV